MVISNIFESRGVSFIGNVFDLLDAKDLENTPTELIQSFHVLDVNDELSVQHFIGQVIFFGIYLLKILGNIFKNEREKALEILFCCVFLLFYSVSVDKEDCKKYFDIDKYLTINDSTVLSTVRSLFDRVMSLIVHEIPGERESIKLMKEELEKSLLSDTSSLVFNKGIFDVGFFKIFLTNKILRKYVESKMGLFPGEFCRSLGEILSLIDEIKSKFIHVLDPENNSSVGLENKKFSIKFLLIPTIFETLPYESQHLLIIEFQKYLGEKIPDLEPPIHFYLLKADWLDYADKLVGFINEIDQVLELFSLFLQEYPFNKVNSLDQRLQAALSSLQIPINQLNKILEATKRAWRLWSPLESLYDKHVKPLIAYLEEARLNIPKENQELQICCQKIIQKLQNKKEFIKLHYQSFFSLKEGNISPRQLINEIVTISHSISITALIEKLNALISASQNSFSWFGLKKSIKPIKPFSEFLFGYQQYSQKELKSNSLLSIDFSIFKCTYVPPVTQGVREPPVKRGERMRVLERSNAPVDWNALYPVDQPVPDYSQLIDVSVFSNSYIPSSSAKREEKMSAKVKK